MSRAARAAAPRSERAANAPMTIALRILTTQQRRPGAEVALGANAECGVWPPDAAVRGLLLLTAMKEGLLGATLRVSPKSELEEARSHVARWVGSQSQASRRLPG